MKKIFLSFFVSISLFSVASAADFGGIGGRPAYPDGLHPNNKEWFIYELNPGDTKEDVIQVQNNDDKETTIVLYPADSVASTDGGFALEQKVESRDFVGKWIQLSQNQVTLGPHQAANIPFTITIPKDPKIDVGEHTGAILMQRLNSAPDDKIAGIQLLTRVGVRVYVTIPGEVIKKLEVSRFGIELHPQKNVYTAGLSVKNTGNVSQNIAIKIRITNLYPWLDTIPWIGEFYSIYPLENEKNLQVLRDDSLTSNFEFYRPFFGKLKIEGFVTYDNGEKILVTRPLILTIGMDTSVIILLILLTAFLVSCFAFLILRKRSRKEKKLQRLLSKKTKKKILIPQRKNRIHDKKKSTPNKGVKKNLSKAL